MIGTIICAAAVTLGVEFGWEPNGAGGLEYIIQIDAESLKNLEKGIAQRSDFPQDLRGLQTIRFQVGDKKLPQVALPSTIAPLSPPEKPPEKLANNPYGKLLAKKAVFETPSAADKPLEAGPEIKKDSGAKKEIADPSEATKPWMLLYAASGTAIGLAAAFLYLLWIHIEMRSRYRKLLAANP